MRKESYIYKRVSQHPSNLLYVLHNCRHCNYNDAIYVPTVTQPYFGPQLGKYVHTCTKCGTKGVLVKWQLKSRWLTLNKYPHKANDPVDVRKTFDSYVETVKTLLGIDENTNSNFYYIKDDYVDSLAYTAGGRASGKTIRGI